MTLIAALAGFGKTTLVTEWLDSMRGKSQQKETSKYQVAWISLDEGDNDLTRFLTYFISALNRNEEVDTVLGEESLSMLQSPRIPPTETVLTPFINELASISGKVILILDDYHLIETQAVHDAPTFLIENFPPQFHIIIATREDPLLPLSRLRGRGHLAELRGIDLRKVILLKPCAGCVSRTCLLTMISAT